MLWMKSVWVSGGSSADVSLSLSLLHAAQQSDLTGLSKLSLCLHLLVQCKMSQGYSSLHLLLNKGYGVTSDVSSILGKYILSLHPHTQHLCWFSHLCREMVPLAGERVCLYECSGETQWMQKGAWIALEPCQDWVSNNFHILWYYVLKHNVRTPAIRARCVKLGKVENKLCWS